MKSPSFLFILATAAIVPLAQGQKGALQYPPAPMSAPPPAPPRIWVAPGFETTPAGSTVTAPPPAAGSVFVYDQKPLGRQPVLLTQEQAQTIMNRFKQAYPNLGSPRILICVNRDLVDRRSGMKLVRRNEQVERTSNAAGTTPVSTVKSAENNVYRTEDNAPPSLADKQTVRDVERLFGRPLRAAGASLVDQKVAADLIADKPLEAFIGTTDTPQSRKDREAIQKIADVVIEILISSKDITVPTISGSQTISIPDIQATAISLKDSKLLGQAASSEVTARVPPATLGNFGVNEITEDTALALMEDMTPGP